MIINLAKIRFGGSGGGTTPAKPEDFFQETYTANGNYDVTPQAGHVFSGGQIEVNVQPRLQTKEATPLTLAQTVSPDAGYDGLQSVTVTGVTSEIDSNITADNIKKDVTILGVTGTLESGIIPTGTINISDNGTYDVTDKATAVVAVGGTDYRYKTGTPDVIGLAAIGWTADDIGYYGANTPHYAWENDNYKVSQKNIDLYSLADPKPDLYKNDPDVTFVPNKNMSKYFGGYRAFYTMKYIKSIPLYDTGSMTYMDQMFNGCSSLQTIPVLDTSSVTSMEQMFDGCSSLTSVPLLDTGNVTNMENIFARCTALASIPTLNTSNVTSMYSMFYGCTALTSVPPLDTSKVTNMRYMFRECSSLQSIPLLDTSNVTSMDYMFSECSTLTSIPPLDTSKVTNMESMFYSCAALTSVPPLNTSKVTDVRYLFSGCRNLTSIPPLDTSSVTKIGYMFTNIPNLTEVLGIDFSGLTSDLTNLFGYDSSKPKLTHFIVNGKINVSISDSNSIKACTNLDYDSIKSILEAANRTDNTNAKTLAFDCVIVDRNGELAGLVSSCATKGWTIQGLTIKEQSVINSITPSKEHLTSSDFGSNSDLVFTVNANKAWSGAGIPRSRMSSTATLGVQIDYYDVSTDKKVREGSTTTTNYWTVASGDAGETQTSPKFWLSSYYMPDPRSGEYALVGISFRDNVTPYEYVDYYFKVYPDGE